MIASRPSVLMVLLLLCQSIFRTSVAYAIGISVVLWSLWMLSLVRFFGWPDIRYIAWSIAQFAAPTVIVLFLTYGLLDAVGVLRRWFMGPIAVLAALAASGAWYAPMLLRPVTALDGAAAIGATLLLGLYALTINRDYWWSRERHLLRLRAIQHGLAR